MVLVGLSVGPMSIGVAKEKGEHICATMQKRSSKLAEKQGALESMREVRNWKAKQGLLTQCFAWQSVYDLETQIQASLF